MLAAESIKLKSTLPFFFCGVPTAIKITLESFIDLLISIEKSSLFLLLELLSTNDSRPGSYIGIFPSFN